MMVNVLRLLVTGLLTFGLAACQSDEPTKQEIVRPVYAVQLKPMDEYTGRSYPGKAKATQEVNLSFDVAGTLNQRPVGVGSLVTKGQLIAQLDQRKFQADLKAAQAQLERESANFKRAESLVKQNFVSQAEYDRMKAQVLVAESHVSLAEKSLSDSTIRAPFAGKISQVFVENYQAVPAKQAVVRLLDASQIEMVVFVPESVISYVPHLQNLNVVFDTFPDVTLVAQVKEISNEATESTRTYPVTLIMNQPKSQQILPGMAGKAFFSGKLPEQLKPLMRGYFIPNSAVFTPDNETVSYVWIVDPKTKKVTKRQVTLGTLNEGGVFVEKGVNEGEWIVTAGVHSLQEGQQVKLVSPDEQ